MNLLRLCPANRQLTMEFYAIITEQPRNLRIQGVLGKARSGRPRFYGLYETILILSKLGSPADFSMSYERHK